MKKALYLVMLASLLSCEQTIDPYESNVPPELIGTWDAEYFTWDCPTSNNSYPFCNPDCRVISFSKDGVFYSDYYQGSKSVTIRDNKITTDDGDSYTYSVSGLKLTLIYDELTIDNCTYSETYNKLN